MNLIILVMNKSQCLHIFHSHSAQSFCHWVYIPSFALRLVKALTLFCTDGLMGVYQLSEGTSVSAGLCTCTSSSCVRQLICPHCKFALHGHASEFMKTHRDIKDPSTNRFFSFPSSVCKYVCTCGYMCTYISFIMLTKLIDCFYLCSAFQNWLIKMTKYLVKSTAEPFKNITK